MRLPWLWTAVLAIVTAALAGVVLGIGTEVSTGLQAVVPSMPGLASMVVPLRGCGAVVVAEPGERGCGELWVYTHGGRLLVDERVCSERIVVLRVLQPTIIVIETENASARVIQPSTRVAAMRIGTATVSTFESAVFSRACIALSIAGGTLVTYLVVQSLAKRGRELAKHAHSERIELSSESATQREPR